MKKKNLSAMGDISVPDSVREGDSLKSWQKLAKDISLFFLNQNLHCAFKQIKIISGNGTCLQIFTGQILN